MRLLRRLGYWLRLRSHHDALIDELEFHREMTERALVESGMSPPAAADAARRAMGNETLMREEARGVWFWPRLEAIWQDARYALRGLRRSPGFTAGVTATLALGIGANTAMFSHVDRLFFRTPPLMVDPATVHRVRLFRMSQGQEQELGGGRYVRYLDLVRWTRSFSHTAGFVAARLVFGTEDARETPIGVVTASFFGFFDAPPLLGRYFTDAEDAPPSGERVAVLSYATWRTQYGGRRDVLGSTVRIGTLPYTIIGVAPPRFVGLWPDQPPAAFIPVAAYGASDGQSTWWTSYGRAIGLGILARRQLGVSIDAANADLTAALARSYQKQNAGRSDAPPIAEMRPRAVAAPIVVARGPKPSQVAKIATWLAGVATIVLLVACANVANLLLLRSLSRRREIAVRLALGVSRGRLLTQLLTESMLLAAFGGIVGVLVAMWGSAALRASFLPQAVRAPVLTDLRTLAFVGVIVLGVGVVTGLAPMFLVRRSQLTDGLKAGVREGTFQPSRTRTALLVTQVALSVVLLVGAGLFVRSLRNVQSIPLGYDVDPLLVVDIRSTQLDSAQNAALRLSLLDAAAALPIVEHATLREAVPMRGMSSYPLFVAGIDSVSKIGRFDLNTVSPSYFATMGTRLLRGRGLEPTDRGGAPRVMVVSEAMGAALWPGTDPIGQCVRIGADTMPCTRVVGIAENIHSEDIGDETGYYYYLPVAQWRPHEGGLFVRTRGEGRQFAEAVRRSLQSGMPGTSYVTVTAFAEIVGAKTRSWSVGAKLFTAFGALALVLAAVGLYSVIAYNVAQRRRELGIRVALGAAGSDVVRLVVAGAVRFAAVGLAIGVGIALASEKWIQPLLFEVSPRDPMVFVLVGGTLLGVALAASSIPAFRAAAADPKSALQSD